MIKLPTLDRPRTLRSRSTRLCIGNALIQLMNEQKFEEIRINDIVSKAGVSRMTYYKYYVSKVDVLRDYLQEMILEYDQERRKRFSHSVFTRDQVMHCIRFFEPYSAMLQTLGASGYTQMITNLINQYLSECLLPGSGLTDYEVFYYSGAVIGMYFRWINTGKKESVMELTDMFCQLAGK
ncbi:MAG: TetR/AcrR family transcriptional regulator [Lachnospiraceae bacterium]|nr:TetR/AcrR family transcriptional regulator [Lachnospiraceae bacterium]